MQFEINCPQCPKCNLMLNLPAGTAIPFFPKGLWFRCICGSNIAVFLSRPEAPRISAELIMKGAQA